MKKCHIINLFYLDCLVCLGFSPNNTVILELYQLAMEEAWPIMLYSGLHGFLFVFYLALPDIGSPGHSIPLLYTKILRVRDVKDGLKMTRACTWEFRSRSLGCCPTGSRSGWSHVRQTQPGVPWLPTVTALIFNSNLPFLPFLAHCLTVLDTTSCPSGRVSSSGCSRDLCQQLDTLFSSVCIHHFKSSFPVCPWQDRRGLQDLCCIQESRKLYRNTHKKEDLFHYKWNCQIKYRLPR